MYNRKNSLAVLLLCCMTVLSAKDSPQGTAMLSYRGSGSYVLVEKTDLRRYDNKKYVGLQSREVQSFIQQIPGKDDGCLYYDGSFFVVQETKHNTRSVRQGIRESIPSSFKITEEGNLVMLEDNGYPSFRSFPAYPRQRVRVGDTWQYRGERAVDPKDSGTITRMPMLVEYTYLRDDVYNGEPVHVLGAQWATRYGGSIIDPHGDGDLRSAQGSHNATIIVSRETGDAIVVRDVVDEHFLYADGTQVDLKGTISLFTKYPPSYDRNTLIHALQRTAVISPQEAERLASAEADDAAKKNASLQKDESVPQKETPVAKKAEDRKTSGKKETLSGKDGLGIDVDNTAAGVRLTIQHLQFKPDSAQLLETEDSRLDVIANVLKEVTQAQLLVEGHTASTGNPAGELRLSQERARVIAEALVLRGIDAQRFICKGSGGTKPVAANSTTEGMARNRRVEITILE